MRSPTDRTRSLWYTAIAVAAFGAVSVPVAAWWALIPNARSSDNDRAWLPPAPEQSGDTERAFDIAAFDVVLWQAQQQVTIQNQQPSVAVIENRPPATPALTLVGILTEEEHGRTVRRAVLYDQSRDELIFAAVGDTVSTGDLAAIDDTGIRIALNNWVYQMPLDGDPGWVHSRIRSRVGDEETTQ